MFQTRNLLKKPRHHVTDKLLALDVTGIPNATAPPSNYMCILYSTCSIVRPFSHRKLNSVSVTHPSTNRARRWVTLLIETNELPLSQKATLILRGFMKIARNFTRNLIEGQTNGRTDGQTDGRTDGGEIITVSTKATKCSVETLELCLQLFSLIRRVINKK